MQSAIAHANAHIIIKQNNITTTNTTNNTENRVQSSGCHHSISSHG